MLPDYDNLRAAFEHAMADGDVDLALRLVTSLPEFVHLRIGYESSGWAERVLEVADRDHPSVRRRRRLRGTGGVESWRFRRGRGAGLARAGPCVPGRGNGRVAYPGDVLADVALYRGRCGSRALAHYDGEMARARRR